MAQSIINDPKSWGKRSPKVDEIKAELTAKCLAWINDYFTHNSGNVERAIGTGLTLEVTLRIQL